jgi:formylglycine-generating enzyme required for sulfatase activity
MRTTSFAGVCTLLIVIAVITIGCGDDFTAPPTGTIIINREPNNIGAPWQLTGPDALNEMGFGDAVLGEMALGSYTLTWGAVAGWTAPDPASATQTLADNGTRTFTGTYVVEAGTITIDPEPNSISAPWQVTGPNGFNESGTGDLTFADLTAGDYTLTWGAVASWPTPSPAAVTQTMTAEGSLAFTGLYVPSGFVAITAGTFVMGSPRDEPGGDHYNSSPNGEALHQVTLTHGFYVQSTEVTNQQYRDMAQWAYEQGVAIVVGDSNLCDNLDGSVLVLKYLGSEPREISFNNGVFSCVNPDHPVKDVTWFGSAAYCDWLSLHQGSVRAYNHRTWQCNAGNPYTAAGYRLPTEAEWEYACRAGSTTAFANGPITDLLCNDQNLDQMGWYCGNAANGTHAVARKLPNAWGLYDMHGNVREWCNYWRVKYKGDITDPVGPATDPVTDASRVIRGGGWNYAAQWCRSAARDAMNPAGSCNWLGFRPVRSGS